MKHIHFHGPVSQRMNGGTDKLGDLSKATQEANGRTPNTIPQPHPSTGLNAPLILGEPDVIANI